VIAVDTNILVYAHRPDAPFHEAARRCVVELAEGRASWALPWPCLHEFVAIVTHPKIFVPPTPLSAALGQVDSWLESPSLLVLAESPDYWPVFCTAATGASAAGPRVHDARIAALCQAHGVRTLWTADRDFTRFAGLATLNPLLPEDARESASAYGASRRPQRSAARRRVRR